MNLVRNVKRAGLQQRKDNIEKVNRPVKEIKTKHENSFSPQNWCQKHSGIWCDTGHISS